MTNNTDSSKGGRILCSDCGQPADIAWVHPTSPDTATPYCWRCSQDNEGIEQDIVGFEMSNFGGYYGVPSHAEYPLSDFDWYIRSDGRYQATFELSAVGAKL